MIEHVEVQLFCHFLGLTTLFYIKICLLIQGRQKQLEQSGQTTEFAPFDENGNLTPLAL
jgi:hypothetical protein